MSFELIVLCYFVIQRLNLKALPPQLFFFFFTISIDFTIPIMEVNGS